MIDESLPDRIGPYRIESEVGRGMMGVVYKARDPRHRRRAVALKVIRILFPVSAEQKLSFEKRFMQEARIVARLSHPGIVGVYDLGRDKRDGAPYMALEFLDGRTLSSILAEGPPLTWRQSLTLMAQVAEALHHAHSKGVIHRDIKPANIMVLSSGQPKIMDFGLAKHEAGMEMTSTGQFMGTPLYMSPEQALGERVTAQSDIFSLGSIAYTLLTGKRAFEAESVPQVMNKVAHQHPPPPTRLSPVIPPEADYLIARSMAKTREDRYANGRMFAEDVKDVLAGRPPRHRKGWEPPAVGEGTVVSDADRRASRIDGEEVELQPIEEPKSRSAAWGLMLLGFALVVLTKVLTGMPFWQEKIVTGLGLAPSPPAAPMLTPPMQPTTLHARFSPAPEASEGVGEIAPSSSPGSAAAPPTSLAVATPPEPGLVPVAVLPAEPTAMPTSSENVGTLASAPLAPRASPETAASPSPVASPRPTARPSSATAKLSVNFEHNLKNGTLRILVDRELVVEQRLTSRVTKDLLVFKLRSGVTQKTFPVAPGQRRIRVEVVTADETRAKETTAIFRANATRRLEVTIGRIRGNLSLVWR